MNKFYNVVGTIEGNKEILFSDFLRDTCKSEIECERESWKTNGYKSIKIESVLVDFDPDVKEIYLGYITDIDQLFQSQAPSFNFELNKNQLLKKALKNGYIKPLKGVEGFYSINQEY